MQEQPFSFYTYLLEAPLSLQITFVFSAAVTAVVYGGILRSISIILTGKLQKAKVIGFKRSVHSLGKMSFPSYHTVLAYEDSRGIHRQTIMKCIPVKNMVAVDVFVTKRSARLIDLATLGSFFFVGSFITYLGLLLFRKIDLFGSNLSFLMPSLVLFILLSRNESQYHYAEKSLPIIRGWLQTKADAKIEKPSEDEYQNLIVPERILSYTEVRKLQKKEGLLNSVRDGLIAILLIGFCIWDIFA